MSKQSLFQKSLNNSTGQSLVLWHNIVLELDRNFRHPSRTSYFHWNWTLRNGIPSSRTCCHHSGRLWSFYELPHLRRVSDILVSGRCPYRYRVAHSFSHFAWFWVELCVSLSRFSCRINTLSPTFSGHSFTPFLMSA